MSNQRYSFSDNPEERLSFKLLYISTSKYEGEWQSHPHTHHFSELFFVIKGQGDFIVEDKRFPLQENDLIIVNPHIEHTEVSVSSNPLEYIVFGIEGLTFHFDEELQIQNYVLLNYADKKEMLLQFFKILIDEMEAKQLNYELICRNLTEVLLMYLVRGRQVSLKQSLDTKMSKECGAAKRYIDSNYSDNITLDFLAALTHMNKYYLVHSFTKYTGLSPINYLTQKRIQVSMDLLSSTNYSVAQISSSVGFSSQSYFSQVFRKTTGLTPIQYRKKSIQKLEPLKK